MADSSAKIEELVGQHYREVKNLLWALTRNESTAEELAQEVFIVAMRKIDESGATGEGLRLWLRETARGDWR